MLPAPSVDVFSCGSVCTSKGYNPTPPVTAPANPFPTAPTEPTTPPKKLITPTLLALHSGEWIAPDALFVIEHDSKEIIEIPEMFEVIDQRKYGRATIELLQLSQSTTDL